MIENFVEELQSTIDTINFSKTLFPLMKASPNLFFNFPLTYSPVCSKAMFIYPLKQAKTLYMQQTKHKHKTLLNSTLKTLMKIILEEINKKVHIRKKQQGFRNSRSIIDTIFIISQIIANSCIYVLHSDDQSV